MCAQFGGRNTGKVTLARLLHARGELARLGFDCVRCKKDKALNEMRGCGVPPRTLTGRPWDAEKWLVDAFEMAQGSYPDGNGASREYTWANIGDAVANTGSPWPWCPAWFARFFDGAETGCADAAIEMAGYVKKKMLPLVGASPLGVVDLHEVVRALNVFDMLNGEAQERRLAEMQGPKPGPKKGRSR